MQISQANFQQIAAQLTALSEFDDLFESCAKLMADCLINGGIIYAVGDSYTHPSAAEFANMLACCPQSLRPPLPIRPMQLNASSLLHFQANISEGDFTIFFGSWPLDGQVEIWLDECLNKEATSLLINPDLKEVPHTDKALELRLEYSCFADYLTSLSAVSNYLTKSIEMQLFGKQD